MRTTLIVIAIVAAVVIGSSFIPAISVPVSKLMNRLVGWPN